VFPWYNTYTLKTQEKNTVFLQKMCFQRYFGLKCTLYPTFRLQPYFTDSWYRLSWFYRRSERL